MAWGAVEARRLHLEAVTSHSLKCTVLSWLAKAGTEPHHRLVLGHHSTQKGSLETYSRDMLAAPLRAMEDVLRRIRVGALRPDMTRSGTSRSPRDRTVLQTNRTRTTQTVRPRQERALLLPARRRPIQTVRRLATCSALEAPTPMCSKAPGAWESCISMNLAK